jgi:TolB-like protein
MDRAGMTPSQRLHFAGFTLDQARACLRGTDGAEIALRPKAFDLLLFLAGNAGRPIAKDALLEAVWPGVHVGEDSLFQAVREARRAIGDEAGRMLRSVPKRGYMLDVAVRQGGGPDEPAAPMLVPPPDRPSLVVLPFANVGGDPEQVYFADGVTEEITMALARFRSFLVIAPTSAATFKEQQPDVREVGRVLGVRYVLEGSVRRAGERLRISGRLVEAATAAHLWADRFEGEAADLFALQDRVTEAAAAALEPRIQQAEIDRALRKPTTDLTAYDLYLRALPHVRARTAAATEIAVPLLEQAISRDPLFARANALLGFTVAGGIFVGSETDVGAARDRCLVLVRRAMEIDGADPLVVAIAGYGFAMHALDFQVGQSLLSRAIELNPNLSFAWLWAGWAAMFRGECDAAITMLERAERIDPLAPNMHMIWGGYGAAHLFAGRYEAAIGHLRRAITRAPEFPGSRVHLVAALVGLGQIEDARREATDLLRIQPNRSIRRTRDHLMFRDPRMNEWYIDSLRQAGIPEE